MVAPWTFLSGMIIYRIFCPREHVKSFILTLNTFVDINSFKKGITCWWSVAETGADKGIHLTHVFAIWLWNIIGYVFGKYPVTNGIDGLGVLPKLTEVKLELMIVLVWTQTSQHFLQNIDMTSNWGLIWRALMDDIKVRCSSTVTGNAENWPWCCTCQVLWRDRWVNSLIVPSNLTQEVDDSIYKFGGPWMLF